MSAIDYDIQMEKADAASPRIGDLESMRPLPRISVHAFARANRCSS